MRKLLLATAALVLTGTYPSFAAYPTVNMLNSVSAPTVTPTFKNMDAGAHYLTCITNADDTVADVSLQGSDDGKAFGTELVALKATGKGPSGYPFTTKMPVKFYRLVVADLKGDNSPTVSCSMQ